MTKIVYEVLEHDGGWAYRMNGAFSESFPSHDDALAAAMIAAKAQQKRLEGDQMLFDKSALGPPEQLDFEILDRSQAIKRHPLASSL